VRRYLPELIDLIWSRKVNPGKGHREALPALRREPVDGVATVSRTLVGRTHRAAPMESRRAS
jgi:hypothetical protein